MTADQFASCVCQLEAFVKTREVRKILSFSIPVTSLKDVRLLESLKNTYFYQREVNIELSQQCAGEAWRTSKENKEQVWEWFSARATQYASQLANLRKKKVKW